MERSQIIAENLRKGFYGGLNKSYKQRIDHLNQLEKAVRQNEKHIIEAIYGDFKKPEFESLLTELLPFYLEIKHFKKKLKSYMREHSTDTPITLFPASGTIHYESKGVVLIIGAWNYPVNLTLIPLIGAIAAGNTVLLKPSEISSHTSAMLARILNQTFDERVLKVVEGGAEETTEILRWKYDHIFYTGSTNVGKIIYESAAKHLTPVTLELGGKSPAIVDENTNLDKAVKRILWGKFVNAGQTCVAPDYLVFPRSKKQELIRLITKYAAKFEIENPEYAAHIINERHFNRLLSYIREEDNFLYKGTTDKENLWMSLHVTDVDMLEHPLMKEEIFGPLLPVIFYDDIEEFREIYNRHPDPLAFYIFSKNKKFINHLVNDYPAGGVLVNDCLMHLAHEGLPFGGRGTSGIGNYHGFSNFTCFSHAKSVMKQKYWMEAFYRYPKYTTKRLKFLKRIVKLIS